MIESPDQIWLSPLCDICKIWPQQSYSEKPKNCDFVIDNNRICGKEPIQYVRADLSAQIHKKECYRKDAEIDYLKIKINLIKKVMDKL